MRMSRYTKQIAIYWPLAGRDNTGARIYGEPVEFKCRWEDIVEEFLDGKGERTISRSKVLYDPAKMEELGVEIELGGLMILDELENIPFPNDPWNDENGQVLEVRQRSVIPDRKARKFLGIAWV